MKIASVTSRFGLPLLAKELIEQAARKRTYVLRVLYALLLFAMSFLLFYETLRVGRASPFAILGKGRGIFEVLMGLQFAGVYLFMPAITSGVLTQEKERNSLMLLFLTRLGPWTIVFEKLLGRLIPMGCFLLLSLPLLAFAYSLGGISVEYLWSGVWILGVATLQMGTLAVFCSAWFRTTVGAFVWSYLIALLMFFGPPFAMSILLWGAPIGNSQLLQQIVGKTPFGDPHVMLFMFFAPVQFFGPGGASVTGLTSIVLRSIPILLSCATFLVLARFFVVRRAFVAPRNIMMNLFKLLDRSFARLNENRVTRGIVLISDKSQLPQIDPVAWRETTKRSLGRARYLFRIFLAIEAPLGAVCLLIAIGGRDGNIEGASMMLFLLWFVAILMVSVQAASLIAGERSHQTLDVLTTTPLTGKQILLQKFRGVQRLMIVLSIPFFTLFVFESWWRGSVFANSSFGSNRKFDSSLYLICAALSVGVYLPLAAWLSLLIGLVVRTQARAIIGALGAIVCWCILPLIFILVPIQILLGIGPAPNNVSMFLYLLSPMMIVPLNEFNELHSFASLPWLAVALNFIGYGTMLIVVRQFCLLNADRFLGRAESQ